MTKKRTLGIAIVTLLIGLLVVPLAGTALAGGGGYYGGPPPQLASVPTTGLTVVGTGDVSVKPDRAFLTVGVQDTAPTARAAQESTSRTISTLIAALQAISVVTDVRTVNVSLCPQYPQPDQSMGKGGTSGQAT